MESSGNNPAGSSSSSAAIEQKMRAPVLMESTEVDVNLSLCPPGDNQGGHANTAQPAQPAVRICLECGATQTPLWRRGPKGMKTLCNACGLKYWKDEKIISTKLTLQPPAACMRPKKP